MLKCWKLLLLALASAIIGILTVVGAFFYLGMFQPSSGNQTERVQISKQNLTLNTNAIEPEVHTAQDSESPVPEYFNLSGFAFGVVSNHSMGVYHIQK